MSGPQELKVHWCRVESPISYALTALNSQGREIREAGLEQGLFLPRIMEERD